jgi:hypothetical protein
VVIKGKSVSGARRLAVHLMRTDTNERAELKEVRGTVAEDLRGALLEMEAVAAGARTGKPFYHGSINTRADERLTDEQRAIAIDRLEAKLGLTGQPRIVVVHEKEGWEHCHIVWSRIDLDRMAAISDSHNFAKHEAVSRDLEREFGHARVQGAHVERDGKPRPERTPSHAEMLQAERTGLSPGEVKDKITELWRRTDSGKAFADALWEAGYMLARGDRRDFVIIDPHGGTHSLTRRIEGARAKDVRERLADIDATKLPNIAAAKELQLMRGALGASRAPERPALTADRSVADQARLDDEDKTKNRSSTNLEWTDRGGMVDQQRAALDWVQAAHEKKRDGVEQTDRMLGRDAEERARTDRQQNVQREFGSNSDRDIDDDFDLGRGRDRSR